MIEKITKYDMRVRENIEEHKLFVLKINELIMQGNTLEEAFEIIREDFEKLPETVQEIIITAFANTLVDGIMLQMSSDKKGIALQKNKIDGEISIEQIPISTRQQVGLATPEDLLKIDNLGIRVAQLENLGISGSIYFYNGDFNSLSETEKDEAITTIKGGIEPVVSDSVIDVIKNYFVKTSNGWVQTQMIVIGSTDGITGVKSSNSDGKIYIESDYTMSVVGWNIVQSQLTQHTAFLKQRLQMIQPYMGLSGDLQLRLTHGQNEGYTDVSIAKNVTDSEGTDIEPRVLTREQYNNIIHGMSGSGSGGGNTLIIGLVPFKKQRIEITFPDNTAKTHTSIPTIGDLIITSWHSSATTNRDYYVYLNSKTDPFYVSYWGDANTTSPNEIRNRIISINTASDTSTPNDGFNMNSGLRTNTTNREIIYGVRTIVASGDRIQTGLYGITIVSMDSVHLTIDLFTYEERF